MFSSIFFIAGFLLFVNLAHAAPSDVVITEIMYDPVGLDTNHEWIELKNIGSESAEIKGGATSDAWRMFMDGANHTFSTTTILNANEYLVVTPSSTIFLTDHPSFVGKIIDMSFSLPNSSSTLGLRIGSDGTIWSEINYSNSWGGNGNGKSLEKKIDDGDNLATNWQESSVVGGTFGAINSVPVVQDNFADSTTQAETTSTVVVEPAKIVINEIYPITTTSTEKEWVELYNATTSTVDISNWALHDNSSTTTLSGVINAQGFLVIEFTNRLNNTGDILQLSDANQNLIDKVAYGNYADGNIADNAQVGDAGQSLARKTDGIDTDSDINDFAVTTSPTRNSANKIVAPVSVTQNTPIVTNNTSAGGGSNNSSLSNYHNIVFISEFLSDPQTNDKEWVEIYNNSNQIINLSNWYLEEGSEEQTKLSGEILAHSFFVIESPKGSLNNSGDIIFLYDSSNSLVDKVSYGSWNDGNINDNAPVAYDGKSVGRKTWEDITSDKEKFFITQFPTPRNANIFAAENNLISHNKLLIDQNIIPAPTSVVINEVLPNPKGVDGDKEYIELANNTDKAVNLAGWYLINSSHKKYFLSTISTISANGFFLVTRKDSKIALKNTGGDFVELYDASNHLMDKVIYEDMAGDDVSYNRIATTSSLWLWSEALTPGRTNILQLPNHAPEIAVSMPNTAMVGEEVLFDASDTFDQDDDNLIYHWDLGNGHTIDGETVTAVYDKVGNYKISLVVDDGHNHKVEQKMKLIVSGTDDGVSGIIASANKVAKGKKSTAIFNVAINEIKNLEIGTQVKTSGVVTVLPNVLSTQMFYIADSETRAGVGIYMFKKDFPDLHIGDRVEVVGELGKTSGMNRIKVKEKKDIKIVDINKEYVPVVLTTDEIDTDYLSSYIEVAGEVLEVNSTNFYLGDEQGEILVVIKKKTGLSSRAVKIGDKVIVKGIVGQSKNGLEIWPGKVEDIKITALGNGVAKKEDNPTSNTDNPYLTATAGGVSSLLLAFLARGRGLVAKTIALGVLSKVMFWKKKKEDL